MANSGPRIKVVCISDTHGLHRKIDHIPAGDLLIHAGDFTNVGEKEQIVDFIEWFASQPHRYKIFIAGNHDVTLHKEYYEAVGRRRFHRGKGYNSDKCRELLTSNPNIIYLEDSSTNLPFVGEDGREYVVNVFGSPWQPEFCNWAFNLERGPDLQSRWKCIPDDTDILITHGPVAGIVDACADGFRAGCADLLQEITSRIRPQLHISGHIHEAYGIEVRDGTTYVNASTCTFHYNPSNPAIVVECIPRLVSDQLTEETDAAC